MSCKENDGTGADIPIISLASPLAYLKKKPQN
jgi:hypothetical protein